MIKIILFLVSYYFCVNAIELNIGQIRITRQIDNQNTKDINLSNEEITGIEIKDVENTFFDSNTSIIKITEFLIPNDYPISCHDHFLPIYVYVKGPNGLEKAYAFLANKNLRGNYILDGSLQLKEKICKVIRRFFCDCYFYFSK